MAPPLWPLNTKIGGQVKNIKDKEAICLMKDQVRYVYKNRIREYSLHRYNDTTFTISEQEYIIG